MRLVALALSLTALAGCLGASPDTAPPVAAPASDAHTTAVDVPWLALAWYADVPPERVAPLVPDGFTLVPCTGGRDRVDVFVIVTEERYPDVPEVPDPVRLVALLTCAAPPDEYTRADANEPPWLTLAAWTDSDAYRAFADARGATPQAATIRLDRDGDVTHVDARDAQGRHLLAAAVAAPGVGVPGPASFASCETQEMRGRGITAGADGALVALDWDKVEAICAAAGTVEWDAGTPAADVLGAPRPPAGVFETRVASAVYTWHTLDAGSADT